MEGNRVREIPTLSAVVSGNPPKHWRLGMQPNDFYGLKGVLQSISDQISIVEMESASPSYWVPTAGGKIFFHGKELGWLGEVHPETLKKWDVDQSVYALELNWAQLSEEIENKKTVYLPPSRYPYIDRDLAILAKETLKVRDIINSIFKGKNKILKEVSLFDLYQGKGIPEGKKSLAFSIRYADFSRTLTDDEVNAVHEEVINRLCKELFVELRK